MIERIRPDIQANIITRLTAPAQEWTDPAGHTDQALHSLLRVVNRRR